MYYNYCFFINSSSLLANKILSGNVYANGELAINTAPGEHFLVIVHNGQPKGAPLAYQNAFYGATVLAFADAGCSSWVNSEQSRSYAVVFVIESTSNKIIINNSTLNVAGATDLANVTFFKI